MSESEEYIKVSDLKKWMVRRGFDCDPDTGLCICDQEEYAELPTIDLDEILEGLERYRISAKMLGITKEEQKRLEAEDIKCVIWNSALQAVRKEIDRRLK